MGTNSPAAQVSRRLPTSLKLNNTDTMSDAEVKNDVAAEAPSAEELKAQKRSAEDDEVDHKKQKTENGSIGAAAEEEGEEEEDAEEEEDIDGEEEEGGEGNFWSPGEGYLYTHTADDEEGEEDEGE